MRYTIGHYGEMLLDRVRMRAYRAALAASVTPDSVVLDIGTGTGIFALLACQLGARRVYAIEPNPAVSVARKVAADNGLSGRIEFIQKNSTDISLPHPADLIVSDLRGQLPLFDRHIPTIIDARARLLAPGGTLIPKRDLLWCAVVSSPELYEKCVGPWSDRPDGLDMSYIRQMALNMWMTGAEVRKATLLTEPQVWARLDYATIQRPHVAGKFTQTVTRPGLAHGLIIGFDAMLTDDVGFSNRPDSAECAKVYGSGFFPWQTPVPLQAGDSVSVALDASLVDNDYVWRWDSCVTEQGARVLADFRQSTFYGTPISLAHLRKGVPEHIPSLDEAGRMDLFVLNRMDGQASLSHIAEALYRAFPNSLTTPELALSHVRTLSRKYSRNEPD